MQQQNLINIFCFVFSMGNLGYFSKSDNAFVLRHCADLANVPSKPSAAWVNFWSEHTCFVVGNGINILYYALQSCKE